MKYLSEKTNKVYNSVEELEKAEKKFDDAVNAEKVKEAQKKDRQKEIEDAYYHFRKLVKKYDEDYPEVYFPVDIFDGFFGL